MADMEVDKVTDKLDDKVADRKRRRRKNRHQHGNFQFDEIVGHRGWLIGSKLFRPEPYQACTSSKLCEFIIKPPLLGGEFLKRGDQRVFCLDFILTQFHNL